MSDLERLSLWWDTCSADRRWASPPGLAWPRSPRATWGTPWTSACWGSSSSGCLKEKENVGPQNTMERENFYSFVSKNNLLGLPLSRPSSYQISGQWNENNDANKKLEKQAQKVSSAVPELYVTRSFLWSISRADSLFFFFMTCANSRRLKLHGMITSLNIEEGLILKTTLRAIL